MNQSKVFSVLVGGSGILGPIWLDVLIKQGHSILVLDKNTESKVVSEDLEFINFDLISGDKLLVDKYLENKLIRNLVINSGIDSAPGNGKSSLGDFDDSQWRKVFDVNLFGIIDLINTFIPKLEAQSSVTFINSMYSIVSPRKDLYSHYNGNVGQVKHPAYVSSKAALRMAFKQYATHYASRGIRFNSLTLGGIEGEQDNEFVEKFSSQVPISRLGYKSELGQALSFIINKENTYFLGQDLIIDGGYTAW